MAFDFDGTGDYITVTDNAALTLPSGDWTLGGWIKLTSNVGSNDHEVFGMGTFATSNSWWVWIDEDSGTSPGEIIYRFVDGSGNDTGRIASTSAPFTSNTSWTNVIWVRSGNVLTCYVDATEVSSASVAGFTSMNPSTFTFSANDASFNLYGALAEWAKWDRALSLTEIANLAAGYSPGYYSTDLAWYVTMISSYSGEIVPLTLTNHGTTTTTHPTIFLPIIPDSFKCTVIAPIPTVNPNDPLVQPTGFQSTVTSGTPILGRDLGISGFQSTVTAGSAGLLRVGDLGVTGFQSTVTMGSSDVYLNIQPSGFSIGPTFGTAYPSEPQSIGIDGFKSTVICGEQLLRRNYDATAEPSSTSWSSATDPSDSDWENI